MTGLGSVVGESVGRTRFVPVMFRFEGAALRAPPRTGTAGTVIPGAAVGPVRTVWAKSSWVPGVRRRMDAQSPVLRALLRVRRRLALFIFTISVALRRSGRLGRRGILIYV